MMELSTEEFKKRYIEKLKMQTGKIFKDVSAVDKYVALVLVVKDLITSDWIDTRELYKEKGVKQVYYFSLEFLPGKFLKQNLTYIGIRETVEDALKELDISLENIEKIEPDPALGNGGLGRLAACFMDSLASLGYPGNGCGLRYKYGLFKQSIVDGYQVEEPDPWLTNGGYWDVRKIDRGIIVKFYGEVITRMENKKVVFVHKDFDLVRAVPYDVPMVGYRNGIVNKLRLWSAESISNDFDFASFSHGDYLKAIAKETAIEAICQVLYPDDSNYENRMLRLKQQYFLVSASVQSIIRGFRKTEIGINRFHEYVAIHINDTHPTLTIPELMRIFMDEDNMSWNAAWDITSKTVSYTNHTILPEAMEKWPVDMVKTLLPRIYMIIEEINKRFTSDVFAKCGENVARNMAIIKDGQVNMAHLAIAGSYSVNGVAKLHTEILKNEVMKDFYHYSPEKFNNKTNGITHRRFLMNANPNLANLISESIGEGWIREPDRLAELKKFKDDGSFIEKLNNIKKQNKTKLAHFIKDNYNVKIDDTSIFDVQIKRIHAYKRQLMNIFHIMYLYNKLNENPNINIQPRTFMFSGKAARGYYEAKQIIKLINTLSQKIEASPRTKEVLKIVFLPNYRVSLAEIIIPAAEVSEQISTASKEASGTGNMKLMMNGAVTLGTLDGANIEILDAVGSENIITFGLNASEVLAYYKNGNYKSFDIYNSDAKLKIVIDQLVNGFFPLRSDEFRVIYNDLLDNNDQFFVLKDFEAYCAAQQTVAKLYKDKVSWGKMSTMNIASSGIFSSDRTIRQYAQEIWKIKTIK